MVTESPVARPASSKPKPARRADEPRNIVICCDGTGNEVEGNLSNVLKLFRIVVKDPRQHVFYDPGVGTIGSEGDWDRFKTKVRAVWGLATGAGLDDNILNAYRFLVRTYEPGDRVFLFGFSRGAYTVRALAAFIQMVGLLRPEQINLCDYAFLTYKRAGWRKEKEDARARQSVSPPAAGGEAASGANTILPADDGQQSGFEAAWDFGRITRSRRVPIHFMGCWDTVASMIVPGRGLISLPTLRTLPYTRTNPSVRAFRHAMAIDERRRMFRLNRWTEGQIYEVNPFRKPKITEPQDCKQLWFAGVHSDVGGGYPEKDSGLSKFPLIWMIEEAASPENGLRIDKDMFDHLALGQPLADGRHPYVPPDAAAELHNSLGLGWWPLEILPKSCRWREWSRPRLFGWYLPLGEPRRIETGAVVHPSVAARQAAVPGYTPVNLPPRAPLKKEGWPGPVLRALSGIAFLAALSLVGICAILRWWPATAALARSLGRAIMPVAGAGVVLIALAAALLLLRGIRPSSGADG